MDKLESILYVVDDLLDTKRKRHIIGGTLLSMSMLFGGLAFTIFTIKNEENDNE